MSLYLQDINYLFGAPRNRYAKDGTLYSNSLFVFAYLKQHCPVHSYERVTPSVLPSSSHVERACNQLYFMLHLSAFAAFQRLVCNILAQMGKAELLISSRTATKTQIKHTILINSLDGMGEGKD